MKRSTAARTQCEGCGEARLCSRDQLCTECHEALIGPPVLFDQGVADADIIEIEV